ncbi:MAG: adenine deaminase [bacterium]|nr:adenine deaminase [bacterium]
MDLKRRLAIARGDEPADRVLRGGRLINVFSGEVLPTDVVIAGSVVVGLGPGYEARESVDVGGRYIAPGLIDAHVHIESAMVPPGEFGGVVVPRGVTSVVTDPHEIANVDGMDGIRFMLEDAERTPLNVYTSVPSCVPATSLATAGATLAADDLSPLIESGEILGLSEMMNYPGVVEGDPDVLDKLAAFRGRPIDGHCPGLRGKLLNAYVAAGIWSDHECTDADEALAKLRRGMRIFVRESSVAQDLDALLPLVRPENERQFCFCTDDRHVPDLTGEGSVDHMVRTAIARGIEPVTAIRMATLNTAEHFGLLNRGALAPGRAADLFVFDDLREPRADLVYIDGRLVARAGRLIDRTPPLEASAGSPMSISPDASDLALEARGRELRVIGAISGQLITEARTETATIEDGLVVADPARDLLKLAVLERHTGSGNVGLGFVHGLGLQSGAIAGTVAHDHHNLIVAGADDTSMLRAARAVAEMRGGLVVADGDTVIESLPLPIAGLMSDLPYAEVGNRLERVVHAARGLGSPLDDPFMLLSFLGLEVIPVLKLTDRGLVDVERMQFVDLFVEGS